MAVVATILAVVNSVLLATGLASAFTTTTAGQALMALTFTAMAVLYWTSYARVRRTG